MLHIYLPFNDTNETAGQGGGLVEGAKAFYIDPGGPEMGADGTYRQKMPLKPNICIHGTPSASLARVGLKDTLYVMAHGRESTSTQIAGFVRGRLSGTRMATMTAAELARALEGDNLSKRVGDLRLLVCFGGYVGGEIPFGRDGDILKRKEGEAPFAGQLCSALKGRGYSRMVVTGYRGVYAYGEASPNVVVRGSNGKTIGHEGFGRSFNNPAFTAPDFEGRRWVSMDTNARTVWY